MNPREVRTMRVNDLRTTQSMSRLAELTKIHKDEQRLRDEADREAAVQARYTFYATCRRGIISSFAHWLIGK